MKKIKTVRSVFKRFKRTALGNFKHKRSNMRHILTKKSSKRKRHLRLNAKVSKKDIKKILICLPYK